MTGRAEPDRLFYKYTAVHVEQDLPVFIKILRPECIDEGRFEEDFQKLIQRLKSVVHASLVPILDGGILDHEFYLVEEKFDGFALGRGLENQHFDHDDKVKVIHQIGNALISLHQEGIIHGELNPAHVFITVDDLAKVNGYGIPGLMQKYSKNPPVLRVEKRRFMAPEVLEGKVSTVASDVYSFASLVGCIFTTEQKWSKSDSRLSGLNLSPKLLDCLQKGMHKDAKMRHSSVEEFLNNLLGILTSPRAVHQGLTPLPIAQQATPKPDAIPASAKPISTVGMVRSSAARPKQVVNEEDTIKEDPTISSPTTSKQADSKPADSKSVESKPVEPKLHVQPEIPASSSTLKKNPTPVGGALPAKANDRSSTKASSPRPNKVLTASVVVLVLLIAGGIFWKSTSGASSNSVAQNTAQPLAPASTPQEEKQLLVLSNELPTTASNTTPTPTAPTNRNQTIVAAPVSTSAEHLEIDPEMLGFMRIKSLPVSGLPWRESTLLLFDDNKPETREWITRLQSDPIAGPYIKTFLRIRQAPDDAANLRAFFNVNEAAALVISDSKGRVIARFGTSSTTEEVVYTLKLVANGTLGQ